MIPLKTDRRFAVAQGQTNPVAVEELWGSPDGITLDEPAPVTDHDSNEEQENPDDNSSQR